VSKNKGPQVIKISEKEANSFTVFAIPEKYAKPIRIVLLILGIALIVIYLFL